MEILIDPLISEANHAISARLVPCSSSRVVIGRLALFVLWSVEFDDEVPLKAHEVDDIRTHGDLAAELVAVELMGAEEASEVSLRAAGLIAHAAGEVALVGVAVHGEEFRDA